MSDLMCVTKRNGKTVPYEEGKVVRALTNAMNSTGEYNETALNVILGELRLYNYITVEEIQDQLENGLMRLCMYKTAKAFILYRKEHAEDREIQNRINYIDSYIEADNAATGSETDPNANVSIKNVANLESEIWKEKNRKIQRRFVKTKLKELYPEVAEQYAQDLDSHILYAHDESVSVPKKYCEAVTLYPLMLEGTGKVDGVTPSPPNDLQSFSGQVTNLVFLLSSQARGAVATGDVLVAYVFYIRKEFGDKWYEHLDDVVTTDVCMQQRTVKDIIRKALKQFIYGVNQPAGNRSYNSPFTNVSYYDSVYFESLFGDFYYPDGTKPEWKEVDIVQRMFMELHRELRLIKPLTFPVSTIAMVHDGKDIIDKEYKELCAEEWAKGGSFFAYINDSPTSLSSCCRVLNEVTDNTFSSTIGLTGIMTGSCNVITLNLNRIVQNYFKEHPELEVSMKNYYSGFEPYMIEILERVYKYQIAFKTGLYDMEDKGMFTDSNGGYIFISKLYSTIGMLGYCEAAEFLGLTVSNNEEYKKFLAHIFSIVKTQNKLHSIRDTKRPFVFNTEAVPGESLAVKFYQWDKADGYTVPEDQNLYSSYFFKQWDDKISILDKLKLHGKYINSSTDGGQACHIHLQEHLSKEQYLKIIELCVKEGVNYFTFNIPMSECKSCGHTVNAPITECPICGSHDIDWWIRIIGYLTRVSSWDKERQIEAAKRVYSSAKDLH